mgnify:CR=1 FL=1
MENNVQAYIVPTSDFHETEYVAITLHVVNICLALQGVQEF